MEQQLEVTVNGVSYPVAELSAEAQAQVTNLQFVEGEITRLNAQLAVYITARIAYENALREALPRSFQ
ncbi:hypothetical protein GM655_02480 [Pseudoduganella danionis]|uniref:Cell division protein ZapA n=1 Tax=Pseudoduganella danionis TaxID=1890295 RepID=A0ABW9SI93_9BURK|nr:hypothetical protein [Pseudoduganella danionis]